MRAAEVNSEFVLTKCDYFLEVQLWPLRTKMDPERWLSNFTDPELDYAVHLLNAFLYFSQPIIDKMFLGAFQSLSMKVRRTGESFLSTKTAWNSFLDNVLITRVTGEEPSDTDSGFHFSRMARQVLQIPEERILSPQNALQELHNRGPRPIVFVDDFVGSGNQFITTWQREVDLKGSIRISFEKFAQVVRGIDFFYCPLVCTVNGHREISRKCPLVIICPAHVLPEKYSALSPDSIIWPDHLRATAYNFLHDASIRAGISEYEWKGFHNLGLSIAFDHGVPDGTLPLFYWTKNNWKPLLERR